MRTLWPAAAVLSLGLVLSGCSDGPEPSARTTTSPSPSLSSRPPSPSPSAEPAPSATPTAVATGAPVAAPAPSGPAPSTAPPARPIAPEAPAARPPAPARPARLTGDGLDLPSGVVPFGTTVEAALPRLTAALGRPTRDSGAGPSFGVYGTCPGTALRAVEYGGGALVVLFGDVSGPGLTLYGWRLTSTGSAAGLPRASAFIGDTTTFDFGVGTSVIALRDGAGEAVQISAGDEIVGPSFRLQDQSPGLYGSLSAATPRGTVTSVQAGRPCGD